MLLSSDPTFQWRTGLCPAISRAGTVSSSPSRSMSNTKVRLALAHRQ